MNSTITISLPKHEKERLERLALRYGLSLPELSLRVLKEVSSDIPEETLNEYLHPRELASSLKRALQDWQQGRVHARL
ncbi:MAG: hypothetical protein A3J55_03295 [Candidatus Ryanbacteria bacterium RIFCSPHIGHO2_02_FULL_45_17b]|uniref:Uncharacterized protein n=1 Tax=Candidatus Ryanbacteria bacterium RIFCSPHIGHO2_01_FULL_45_22 TaxID=1802114 RepID=A0A1G2G1Y4_9BACT|nr:MAG: hypothetical protein A2719_04495 [Candidatus Ryanbacteria bacterium RIFCSPHIGHO2_01_FULL_45_22]OGZ47487.1 MAG: hypothetical protein A3J55_03295 [Candidatus Ryanbacteria bacterium RIFCSPHIGHO2_02_FULL_45_17b]